MLDTPKNMTHQKIIAVNDDKTPMEFVVHLLRSVFDKSETEAKTIMLAIHANGEGVCGTYPIEAAQVLLKTAQDLITHGGFPLVVKVEPTVFDSKHNEPIDPHPVRRQAKWFWPVTLLLAGLPWLAVLWVEVSLKNHLSNFWSTDEGHAGSYIIEPKFALKSKSLDALVMNTYVSGSHLTHNRWEWRTWSNPREAEPDFTLSTLNVSRRGHFRTSVQTRIREIKQLSELDPEIADVTDTLPTRFGSFEITAFSINEPRNKFCLGYQGYANDKKIYVSGWYCGRSGEAPRPITLTCLINRLDLREQGKGEEPPEDSCVLL
jgi:ATP-dependent Clp protease adaptor protein ClpS